MLVMLVRVKHSHSPTSMACGKECLSINTQLMVVYLFTPSVPTAPRLFRAAAVSPTAITLTWLIPANPNGELSYVLNYTALHANIIDTEQFELTNGLQTTYNVTDLQENVEYEFFLWAKTEIGLSDPVIAQEKTFEDGESWVKFGYLCSIGLATLDIRACIPPYEMHHTRY